MFSLFFWVYARTKFELCRDTSKINVSVGVGCSCFMPQCNVKSSECSTINDDGGLSSNTLSLVNSAVFASPCCVQNDHHLFACHMNTTFSSH